MAPEMTVAPATSQKRIEANRRNALKSTGSRTAEGKNRSRFNGLKHGLAAKVGVLPGDDPAEYEAHLISVVESCAPTNQVEVELLERVGATTWALGRAREVEAARLAYQLRHDDMEREAREQDEALALGERLLCVEPSRPVAGVSARYRLRGRWDFLDLLLRRTRRSEPACPAGAEAGAHRRRLSVALGPIRPIVAARASRAGRRDREPKPVIRNCGPNPIRNRPWWWLPRRKRCINLRWNSRVGDHARAGGKTRVSRICSSARGSESRAFSRKVPLGRRTG
jgi:hypothetical protein